MTTTEAETLRRVFQPVMRPPTDPRQEVLIRRLQRVAPRLSTLASGGAALAGVMLALAGQPALAMATLGAAAMVMAIRVVSRVWSRLSELPGWPAPEVIATAFRAQAAALVTLQGVVLTLVLTLAGDDPSPAIKVGAIALVVGVLLGLLQGGMVALGVSGPGQLAMATTLFSLTTWACAYGLLCLAADLVIER